MSGGLREPQAARAGRRLLGLASALGTALVLVLTVPPASAGGPATYYFTIPGQDEPLTAIITESNGRYYGDLLRRYAWTKVEAHGDPSLCYRFEITNTSSAEDDVFFTLDVPIDALGENTVRGTLDIELVDADGDGDASLTHRAGFNTFQRGYINDGIPGRPFLVSMGAVAEELLAPGTLSLDVGFDAPLAGQTTDGGFLTLVTSFLLSTGDAVLVRGSVLLDDGGGAPLCSVPGPATMTGCSDPDAILGTDGPDDIDGTPGDDVICTGAGRDRVDAGAGNDVVWGGAGKDTISGGRGRDQIHGEEGNDILCGDDFVGTPSAAVGSDPSACSAAGGTGHHDKIWGDDGNDAIGGGPGRDILRGGPGNDKLAGAAGNDRLFGDDGKDRLSGGTGKDVVRGDADPDRLFGDEDDDTLVADDGEADVAVKGGDGSDSARIDAGIDANVTGIETFLP